MTLYGYLPGQANNSSISKIDLNSFSVLGAIGLTGGFDKVPVTATDSVNQFMYVANGFHYVTKINISTFTVVATLNIPGGAGAIVIDPTDTFMYTSNPDWNNYVTKIDLSTFTVVTSIGVVGRTLCIDNAGGYLYAVSGSYVTQVKLSTFSPVNSIAKSGSYLYIDTAQQYLYVDNYRVKLSTFTVDLSYLSSYIPTTVDSTSTYAYTINPSAATAIKYVLATGALVATCVTGGYPIACSLQPGVDATLYVINNSGKIMVRVATSGMTNLAVWVIDNSPGYKMEFGPGSPPVLTSQFFTWI